MCVQYVVTVVQYFNVSEMQYSHYMYEHAGEYELLLESNVNSYCNVADKTKYM